MTHKRSNRTTIIIEPEVRDTLKHIARKDQSYNALLLDLIQLHKDHTEKPVQEVRNHLTLQNQNRIQEPHSDHFTKRPIEEK